MAFQQGLSGLNASSKGIDVISHNIANASTVGFKSSQAHFADVYAASLSGGSASQVGIGVSLASVFQQFTQGNITTTNNSLDISINGGGFFRMSDNGAVSYTRNGQFHLDKDGYIMNDQGLRLTGYGVSGTSGSVVPSTPVELQIDASDISPVATGASQGAAVQGVTANINLYSRAAIPATSWGPQLNQGTPPTVPATGTITVDPNSYNYSTAQTIYDSLGNPHTLTYYFVKTATPGDWQVHASVDGTQESNITYNAVIDPTITPPTMTPLNVAGVGNPLTFHFNTDGTLESIGTTTAGVTFKPEQLAVIVNLGDPAIPDVGISYDLRANDLSVPLNAADPTIGNPITGFAANFGGSTQYGSASGVNSLTQDGYSSGRLAGISVGANGTIQGRYTNGQTTDLGQVVLANFRNPNGLQPQGDNQWTETFESGGPLVGAPGSASLGNLQSNSIEESNVDLTGELVNMITMQRNYQANAQSIKTQDQIMNTLVNLR